MMLSEGFQFLCTRQQEKDMHYNIATLVTGEYGYTTHKPQSENKIGQRLQTQRSSLELLENASCSIHSATNAHIHSTGHTTDGVSVIGSACDLRAS